MANKMQAFRKWIEDKGCIIHPNVDIPMKFNGVQGIGANAPLPPKTLIIAIPSSLILSV